MTSTESAQGAHMTALLLIDRRGNRIPFQLDTAQLGIANRRAECIGSEIALNVRFSLTVDGVIIELDGDEEDLSYYASTICGVFVDIDEGAVTDAELVFWRGDALYAVPTNGNYVFLGMLPI